MHRIAALVEKELIQLWRDRVTLLVMLAIPLIQLFLFGYAISTDVKHIPLAVADQSLDQASRDYLRALVNSGFFDVEESAADQSGVVQAMDAGRAQAGLVIPPSFGHNVTRGQAQVLMLVDGSDLFTSQSAYNAASLIGQNYAMQLSLQKVQTHLSAGPLPSLTAHLRVLYNPDIKDSWFIIPGMLAMLLQNQTIVLTAAAVVREREVGTMEQILVTPIRPFELMLGKTLPYLVIAVANILTILALGMFWFGVPFQGDLWLFLGLIGLYAVCGLGLGLLISTVSQNQRQAQQLVNMITMLALVLGGFYFPRYTMPALVQWIGDLFPLTHFVPIARGIMTKGIGLAPLAPNALALAIYLAAVLFLCTRAFRERLE